MTTIGIGITTRNRPGQAERVAAIIEELTPGHPGDWEGPPFEVEIVIVDDASEQPVQGAFRFEENVGIARAKNKCLELLDENDHIFLFDDDAYPLVEDWWKPYVESPEPHLMRIFGDLAGPDKLRDIVPVYQDTAHVAWSGPRGMMLYIDARVVLPVVGGMDPIYGLWGYEHGDWSNRIHANGMTSWRYADVVGGEALIYSMDEHQEIDRTVASADRKLMAKRNAGIHNVRRADGYKEYVEYREYAQVPPGNRDVVITHLYSSKPDPQRPGLQYPPDLTPAAELLESLRGQDAVVISDRLYGFGPVDGVECVLSQLSTNLFFQRHLDTWRYLRSHPGVRWVWCVDATDVEMLNEPWEHMRRGTVYVGHEPSTVNSPWLRKNHPSPGVQTAIRAYGRRPLLNPGVIGGEREVVMAFLQDMFTYHFDEIARRHNDRSRIPADLGDMGAVQVVGYGGRHNIVADGTVVSEFRKMDRSSAAWWRHK